MRDIASSSVRRPRIGSLFSGDGGLDLAVKYDTGGEAIWFSEINAPVARVFAYHWPMRRTSATSPTSTGPGCRRWTFSAAASRARTFRLSVRVPGSHLGPARDWSYVETAIEALQPEARGDRERAQAAVRQLQPPPDPSRGARHDDRNPEPATAVRNQEHAQAFLARSTLR